MNRIRRVRPIRRVAGALAVLTGALLAAATAAPAAFAYGAALPPAVLIPRPEPPGWNTHPPLPAHTHPMVTGSMPGWQIALIAVVAALLAAALAVTAGRTRAARRRLAAGA